jgi:hypothetical protein
MRALAFVVAVAATPMLLAPTLADGIPGYREEVNPPESIPYQRVEPRVVVPAPYPPAVIEAPLVVVPRVIVRRPVVIEPPFIVARPRVYVEPQFYAYSPVSPVVRFGSPGRHLGHFRHGY